MIENYKEIVSKRGTKVVFCNFEELLMDYYQVKDFSQVPPPEPSGEWIIHCPFCKEAGHTKHKLYIKDDMSVGHCFVCTRAFVHVDDQVRVEFEAPSFMPGLFGFKKFELTKLTHPVWSIDKFKYEFDDYDERGVQYLVNRNKYLAELWKPLGIKFMDGNPVIPFYDWGKDDVVYYQIRFAGQNKIKYFLPPIKNKLCYTITQPRDTRTRIVIAEGIFDVTALLVTFPSAIPIAVLGSHIADYQMDYIRENITPSEIFVYMDETKISRGIVDSLKTKFDYCPITIIPSNGEDPEENMRRLAAKSPGQEIGYYDRLYASDKTR